MKETGGAAFPGLHPSAECRYQDADMTLRDYFAAKAMQGLLAHGEMVRVSDAICAIIAGMSYRMADAMLAERSKE